MQANGEFRFVDALISSLAASEFQSSHLIQADLIRMGGSCQPSNTILPLYTTVQMKENMKKGKIKFKKTKKKKKDFDPKKIERKSFDGCCYWTGRVQSSIGWSVAEL